MRLSKVFQISLSILGEGRADNMRSSRTVRTTCAILSIERAVPLRRSTKRISGSSRDPPSMARCYIASAPISKKRRSLETMSAMGRVSRAPREYPRRATIREMKEGPSSSAIRCWSQATASCCGQKPWWWALRKRRNEIPAGKVERGERKRTAAEVSKAD